MVERYYPVGIQTFSEIINGGYVYIDKTDLMWRMQNRRKYIFLSRPRRFGKSLLSSTLQSYFEGHKELFCGLKIMALESEWENYPVIHLDLSIAKGKSSSKELSDALMWLLQPYCELYGQGVKEDTPGKRIMGLITRAYHDTGKQAVIIIDEHDAPLLEIGRASCRERV